MASVKAFATPPPAPSTSIFKEGIFNGKVLFCTGGGSGICKEMTEAVVSYIRFHILEDFNEILFSLDMVLTLRLLGASTS